MGDKKLSEGHGFIEGIRICLGGQRGFSGVRVVQEDHEGVLRVVRGQTFFQVEKVTNALEGSWATRITKGQRGQEDRKRSLGTQRCQKCNGHVEREQEH